MNNKKPKALEVITSKIVAAGSGAIIGTLIGGVPGTIIGAAYGAAMDDISQRMLSPMEKNRLETIQKLAESKFKEQMERGAGLRKDINQINLKELYEGMLLTARESYEERKLPLIANLIATAPFTNTPVENLIQTLITAEQLSYRQLCIIGVIGQNEWENIFKLREEPLQGKHYTDEKIMGIYQDLNYLVALGILGQVLAEGAGPAISSGAELIAPVNLVLLYPGKLLFNAMNLDTVDKKDFDEIVKILKS